MRLTEKYSGIGLPLEGGFPEFYHVFNHGATTADIGRTGGVDTLGFIDVREAGGMMFPNRWYSHVLNRESWHMGRPMYGPAVKFLSTDRGGTVYHHAPVNGRILPYGVISSRKDPDFGDSSYHLFLERERTLRLILKTTPGIFQKLNIAVSKYHVVSGNYRIRQNQLTDHEYGVEMLSPEQLDKSYLEREPFRNAQGVLEWSGARFDEKHNALVCSGMRTFEDGRKIPLFMVFGCSGTCSCDETSQDWFLRCGWNAGTEDGIAVSIALGEDLPALLRKVSMSCRETESRLEELLRESEKIEKESPEILIPAIPEAADFARIVRNAQSSITIRDSGKYAAILASSGKFGYFVAWDHNYPIRDFITTGDFETAGRLLRYGIDYPNMKTVPFSVSQLILEVGELAAFEGNTDFLKENWKKLLEEFDYCLRNYTDRRTGMLKSTHCCGVDNPAEIGLSRFFYAACLNAWHYAALRTMTNFALLMNDGTNARKFRSESEKLEKYYPYYFHHEKKGALRAAVNDDYSFPVEVFHNSSTIGLDYPYGEFLLRRGVHGIARFFRTRLRHPDGYSAVPYDSDSPCEMWRSVYMNQHLGHNTRLARLDNDMPEVLRVAKHYFREFRSTGTAVETFNLEGCDGDVSQRTKWQAFSATGALHCLHQSVAGIAWSRGGLVYLPADDSQKIEIRKFKFGGRVWHISVEGCGRFASSVKLNGTEVSGSMQIPVDLPGDAECRLEIVRSAIPWTKPVLLYATDVPIRNLSETGTGGRFTVAENACSPMKFFTPGKTTFSINGETVPSEYFPEEQTAWIDCVFSAGDTVEYFIEEAIEKTNQQKETEK